VTEPAPFAHLGVVGLGLVGGSVARAARVAWPGATITGVDRPSVLEAALAAGAITAAGDGFADLRSSDVVVLATPIPALLDLLAEAGRTAFPGLITDVGSVKRVVRRAAAAHLVRRFVGGHPMAGGTGSGFEAGSPDLFRGRPWFVVPAADDLGQTPGAAADAGHSSGARLEADARTVAALARGLGAVPRPITADAHDRLMAHVSHVPHLVAVAVMNAAAEACGAESLGLAGAGFADVTRLAASDGDLWSGILTANTDYVEDAAAAVAEALCRLAGSREVAPVAAAFRQANAARRDLDSRRAAARRTT
jgi:prephenate dehydrogenase